MAKNDFGSGALATLESHKAASARRRLEKIRPVHELARIFLAQRGDPEARRRVTVGEAAMYESAETFSEFLYVNRLPAFEEVLR